MDYEHKKMDDNQQLNEAHNKNLRQTRKLHDRPRKRESSRTKRI